MRGERQAKKLIQEIVRVLGSEQMASLDYAFVADPETLEPVSKLQRTVLIGVGARIGETALNDSLLAEIPPE